MYQKEIGRHHIVVSGDASNLDIISIDGRDIPLIRFGYIDDDAFDPFEVDMDMDKVQKFKTKYGFTSVEFVELTRFLAMFFSYVKGGIELKTQYRTTIGKHDVHLYHHGCIMGIRFFVDGKDLNTVEHNLNLFGKLDVDHPDLYDGDDEQQDTGIEACDNAKFIPNELDMNNWLWQHFLQEYNFTEDELKQLHHWVGETISEMAKTFGYCSACLV